jgi:hypothetical protein
MIERSDPVRATLEQLAPTVVGVNDWRDVVVRAQRRRLVRETLCSAGARRAAFAALAALVVAVPTLAATGTLQALWHHRGPEIGISTLLHDPSGERAGSFRADLPGVVLTQDRPHHLLPHRMLHHGGLRPADTYPLRWEIELSRGKAASGRIVYKRGVAHAGTTVAQLCRPCRSNANGVVVLTRNEAALLLNGQLALSLQTDHGTLRGIVPASTQRGLLPRTHGR